MNRRFAAVLAGLMTLLGSMTAAVVTAPASSAAARIVYTYEVRGLGNTSSLSVFATQAAQTYADGRGWGLGGSIAFRRVASGGNFTLWLASAARVPGFGYPCDSGYSCRVGRNVVINESRWLTATPMWSANHRSIRDYRHMVINHETGHWLGFGHASCGGAGQTAPVMQQQSISLQGCRPNPWPLASERRQLALSRHVPIITGSPTGSVDAIIAGPGKVTVRGWMIDPNTSASGRVHVYVDRTGRAVTASGYRPDIARRYPAFGSRHGFSATLPAGSGAHRVCVYAMNLTGPGVTTTLGCRTITIGGSPRGHVDSITASAGSVRVTGWALDPDTAGSIRVHAYVDSRVVAATANLSRSDLARRFPGYGALHGFAVDVAADAGRHRVCAYGINALGTGHNTALGCGTVTVPA